MARPKPIIARLSPLIDLIIVTFLIYKGCFFINLLSPCLNWEISGTQYLLCKTPFASGILVCSVPILLAAHGFYKRANRQSPATAAKQIIGALFYYLVLSVFFGYFIGLSKENEHYLVIALTIYPLVIYLRYLIFHYLQRYTIIGKPEKRQILIIGLRTDIERGWSEIPPAWKDLIYQPHFAYTEESTIEEVQETMCQQNIQIAYIYGGHGITGKNREVISICKKMGIDIYFQLDKNRPEANIQQIGNDYILTLNYTPHHAFSYTIKGIVDRIMALLLLILSTPLWIIAAIGIKRSDPKGPIFYKQLRSGRFGKPFNMWKFRSMYIDADKRLQEIKEKHGNEMSGPIFKLTDDPRVFSFGHFIRKSSIDELPQLLNILMGDMSIVGPRPLPVYETDEFPQLSDRRRLSVKPGLTCYWQVEDRSSGDTNFSTMVEKDLKYIDNWSFWLDVKLFLRTIPAVLMRRGAK